MIKNYLNIKKSLEAWFDQIPSCICETFHLFLRLSFQRLTLAAQIEQRLFRL